jgi:4-amino-4-deoxy-L-arabinose transferase-like glycosyltransferase
MNLNKMINKVILFLENLDERQTLVVLVLIAFGLRLYAVLMAKGIAVDSAAYGFMARDFMKGDLLKALSTPFPPFYPFLISLISSNPSEVEIRGRFLSLIIGTLAIIPVYYLAREILGQKRAILSCLFYVFHPYLVTYSGMFLTEATYWGLLALSAYFFWKGLVRESVLRLMISGSLLAFSYLTRPEGMGYLFVFLIWVLVHGGFKRRWVKKSLLIGGLILPFLFLSIPYIIYIHHETGQWLISKKAVKAQSEVLDLGKHETDQMIANLFGMAGNTICNLPYTLYHYLRAYHFTLWPFLFFGLIRRRERKAKEELFLTSMVLFHLVSLATFIPSTIRFSVPVIPLSLFWAGAGVLEMGSYLQRIKMVKPANLLLFFIVLSLLAQLPQSLRPERRHRADQKKVGIWLKQNTPEDAIIMSNSPIETFYAERAFVALPSEKPGNPRRSYDEVIEFARKKGIRYILIDQNTQELNPDFIASIRKEDLKECYKHEKKDGDWIILYEVMD